MGVYIKNWSLADWKELLMWAKIGANNAMIGEFAEVEELPPHGRLIDADALKVSLAFAEKTAGWAVPALRAVLMVIDEMPTIIPAEGDTDFFTAGHLHLGYAEEGET